MTRARKDDARGLATDFEYDRWLLVLLVVVVVVVVAVVFNLSAVVIASFL